MQPVFVFCYVRMHLFLHHFDGVVVEAYEINASGAVFHIDADLVGGYERRSVYEAAVHIIYVHGSGSFYRSRNGYFVYEGIRVCCHLEKFVVANTGASAACGNWCVWS